MTTMNDASDTGYEEITDSTGTYVRNADGEGVKSFKPAAKEPPPTGHGLAIAVIDLLAKNKDLVLSISYTLRKDGAVEFSFETHPEERTT
jgi:hypothetical protein